MARGLCRASPSSSRRSSIATSFSAANRAAAEAEEQMDVAKVQTRTVKASEQIMSDARAGTSFGRQHRDDKIFKHSNNNKSMKRKQTKNQGKIWSTPPNLNGQGSHSHDTLSRATRRTLVDVEGDGLRAVEQAVQQEGAGAHAQVPNELQPALGARLLTEFDRQGGGQLRWWTRPRHTTGSNKKKTWILEILDQKAFFSLSKRAINRHVGNEWVGCCDSDRASDRFSRATPDVKCVSERIEMRMGVGVLDRVQMNAVLCPSKLRKQMQLDLHRIIKRQPRDEDKQPKTEK